LFAFGEQKNRRQGHDLVDRGIAFNPDLNSAMDANG